MSMGVRDREDGRPQTINQNEIFVRKSHGNLLRHPTRLGFAAPRSHCLANKHSTARYGAHSLGQGGPRGSPGSRSSCYSSWLSLEVDNKTVLQKAPYTQDINKSSQKSYGSFFPAVQFSPCWEVLCSLLRGRTHHWSYPAVNPTHHDANLPSKMCPMVKQWHGS